MKAARKIEALIGSTPLVDLSGLADGAATIYGKYEATNPGGSVKDASPAQCSTRPRRTVASSLVAP